MSWQEWPRYVPVAERRKKAAKKVAQLKKQGRFISPVTIEGRTIAKSFWGKSWCSNLERYSDYESRLPRGRTYVRNGSVVDLQIAAGEISALVAGSELYSVAITISPVAATCWKAICADCAGSIDSLVELLQGRLSKAVMDRVCRKGDGLFPAPGDIELSCSCPDWADMCKHVAAVLNGVGARVDAAPRLLFTLRGVDESELLASAGQGMELANAAPAADKVLDDDDVTALFGLEMAGDAPDTAIAVEPAPSTPTPAKSPKLRRGRKSAADRKDARKRRARPQPTPRLASKRKARKQHKNR
ncbi:MAG: SWIM zinc finger family protein [Anaerolineales bacterium]